MNPCTPNALRLHPPPSTSSPPSSLLSSPLLLSQTPEHAHTRLKTFQSTLSTSLWRGLDHLLRSRRRLQGETLQASRGGTSLLPGIREWSPNCGGDSMWRRRPISGNDLGGRLGQYFGGTSRASECRWRNLLSVRTTLYYLWRSVDRSHEFGVLAIPVIIRQKLFPSFFIKGRFRVGIDEQALDRLSSVNTYKKRTTRTCPTP